MLEKNTVNDQLNYWKCWIEFVFMVIWLNLIGFAKPESWDFMVILDGIWWDLVGVHVIYPLVNSHIAMEHHHVWGVNQPEMGHFQ